MKRHIIALLAILLSVTSTVAQTAFRDISLENALNAAADEGKLVFIDFYTSWCGPCKKMVREVFPLKSVGDYMNEHFVSLKMDAEKEGSSHASRYSVRSYPTYIILDARGNVVSRLAGAMDAAAFLATVAESLTPEMSAARIEERYNSGERDDRLVRAYAMQLMEAKQSRKAVEVVDSHFAELSDSARLDPANHYIYTTFTMGFGNDKGRFMRANAPALWAAGDAQLRQQIARLYDVELQSLFTGRYPAGTAIDRSYLAALTRDIDTMGLNSDGHLTARLDFISHRIDCDDPGYLAYCTEHLDTLTPAEREALISALPTLFARADGKMRTRLVSLIRRHKPSLSASGRSKADRAIAALER